MNQTPLALAWFPNQPPAGHLSRSRLPERPSVPSCCRKRTSVTCACRDRHVLWRAPPARYSYLSIQPLDLPFFDSCTILGSPYPRLVWHNGASGSAAHPRRVRAEDQRRRCPAPIGNGANGDRHRYQSVLTVEPVRDGGPADRWERAQTVVGKPPRPTADCVKGRHPPSPIGENGRARAGRLPARRRQTSRTVREKSDRPTANGSNGQRG